MLSFEYIDNNTTLDTSNLVMYKPEEKEEICIDDMSDEEELTKIENGPEIDFHAAVYQVVSPKQIIRQLGIFLKLHSLIRANNAIDIIGIDQIDKELRFLVSYQLQSIKMNIRYNILTRISSEKLSLLS
jgi:NADH:ubiquinone oxidoreductase subunit C